MLTSGTSFNRQISEHDVCDANTKVFINMETYIDGCKLIGSLSRAIEQNRAVLAKVARSLADEAINILWY